MNESEFRASVREDGYDEPQLREFSPGYGEEMHTHDFSARLLVLEGTMTLVTEDGERVIEAGESCSLEAGVLHSERWSPGGTKALVARKQPD